MKGDEYNMDMNKVELNSDVMRLCPSSQFTSISLVQDASATTGEYYIQDSLVEDGKTNILTADEVVSLYLSKLPAHFYYVSDNSDIPSGIYRMRVVTTTNPVVNADRTKVIEKLVSKIEYFNRLFNQEHIIYSCTFLHKEIKHVISIIFNDLNDILKNQQDIIASYEEALSILSK